MNIATGTFGSGIPQDCPDCKRILDFEVVCQGWSAEELNTPKKDKPLVKWQRK